MAASPLSLPIYSDLQISSHLPHKTYFPSFISSSSSKQSINFHNFRHTTFKSLSSSSNASTTISSQLEDSFKTGKFLTSEEIFRLKQLQDFCFQHNLDGGSMRVRVMRNEDMDSVVSLLSDSFSASMLLHSNYDPVLRFLVRQYVTERREMLPHSVTLVAFYKDLCEEKEILAGTVELSLNKMALNSPSSPTPPLDSPYICNMSVNKTLRRKGIGWNLLKATEELIAAECGGGSVYLHCRIIDTAPFNLYTKAGYSVVKTDSILVLLKLQRRKHLMCKNLDLL